MDYIEWNYIQAKRQAANLSEQAEKLDRLAARQMQETLGKLSSNWEGENARMYLRKGDGMKTKLEGLSGELKRAAEVIRSSAERTYRAEIQARELARVRSYR